MEKKAKKYDALRRGDYSGLTEKEMAEAVIDVSVQVYRADYSSIGRGRRIRMKMKMKMKSLRWSISMS